MEHFQNHSTWHLEAIKSIVEPSSLPDEFCFVIVIILTLMVILAIIGDSLSAIRDKVVQFDWLRAEHARRTVTGQNVFVHSRHKSAAVSEHIVLACTQTFVHWQAVPWKDSRAGAACSRDFV